MMREINTHDSNSYFMLPVPALGGYNDIIADSAYRAAKTESRWYSPKDYPPYTHRRFDTGKQTTLIRPENPDDILFLDTYASLLAEIPPEKQINQAYIMGVGTGAIDLSTMITMFDPKLIVGSNITWAEWDWLKKRAPDLFKRCVKLIGGVWALAWFDHNIAFDLISSVRGGVSGLNISSPVLDPKLKEVLDVPSDHVALLRLFGLHQEEGGYLIVDFFTQPMAEVLSCVWEKPASSLDQGFFSYEDVEKMLAQSGYKLVGGECYNHSLLIQEYFQARRFPHTEVSELRQLMLNPIRRPLDIDLATPTHMIVLAKRTNRPIPHLDAGLLLETGEIKIV